MTNTNANNALLITSYRSKATRAWASHCRIGNATVCGGGKTRAESEAHLMRRLREGGYLGQLT